MNCTIHLKGGDISISSKDYQNISQYKWTAQMARNWKRYVIASIKLEGKWKTVQLHRFILGAKKGQEVDHVNGDTLNNTRENLRICTKSQNRMNQDKYKNNNSGYKGVHFDRHIGKWRAQVNKDGTYLFSKYYDNLMEAVDAYNKNAKRYHGEFARTNCI